MRPSELASVLARSREGHCDPSDRVIDLVANGELRADSGPELSDRIAACKQETERFRIGHDPDEWLASLGREARGGPRRHTWWRPLLAAAAGAVVIVAVVLLRPPGDLGTRSKGESAFKVFIKRDTAVMQLAPGDHLMPNDELAVTVTSAEMQYVAVLSLDPTGALLAYLPFDGAVPVAAPAGSDVAVPGAVRLDGTIGEETLILLACGVPVSLTEVRSVLKGWFEAHGRTAVPAGIIAGCGVDLWTLEKGRRP